MSMFAKYIERKKMWKRQSATILDMASHFHLLYYIILKKFMKKATFKIFRDVYY